MPEEAAWTWMIYLATHNNAAEVGAESVARMHQAALNDQVRVLVQQSTLATTVRFRLDAPEQATDLGQVDSGAVETLLDFVRWAVQTAPAQHYALVLWSHGSGWSPDEMARLARNAPAAVPVTASELKQRGEQDTAGQVFFSSSLREILRKPTPSERAIAFDDGSGHSLDTIELGQVVARAARAIGRPLDLVGMNACQMSCVEVAYQLRGNADVYVASQEDMPVAGWPYADILSRLAAQPTLDSAALAALVVERYCAYFRNNPLPWGQGGYPAGVTLAALYLRGIPKLAGAVQALTSVLRSDMDNLSDIVWAAHAKAHKFKFQLCDLSSFCNGLLAATGAPTEVVAAAQGVLAVLADPSVVVAHAYLNSAYADTGGLTTYLMPPGTGKPLSPYYAETDYAQATRWGDFLSAYHTAVAG